MREFSVLQKKQQQGFTIAEAITAIGVFSILALIIALILINSFRSNAVIWEQLKTQSEGRQAIQYFVDDVRRAESSSIGSYPIVTSTDYEMSFYANADGDALREQIRFFITTTTLYRGETKPTGTPLSYEGGEETVRAIATDVVNIAEGVPVFSYYDESYTGTQSPMGQPVTTTDIRVIKIELELEKDPTETPIPLHVESTVHVRNLKEN